jgi:RNA polymerase sigma-70 factor (ECF subfamily)
LIADLQDPQSELSQQWDREHDRFVMKKLLDDLKAEFEPKTWLAFQRFALEQVPAAKVAAELEISANAVFIAKSRVLARLRVESQGILDE